MSRVIEKYDIILDSWTVLTYKLPPVFVKSNVKHQLMPPSSDLLIFGGESSSLLAKIDSIFMM